MLLLCLWGTYLINRAFEVRRLQMRFPTLRHDRQVVFFRTRPGIVSLFCVVLAQCTPLQYAITPQYEGVPVGVSMLQGCGKAVESLQGLQPM